MARTGPLGGGGEEKEKRKKEVILYKWQKDIHTTKR
jgi:hypothetical protein